MTRRGQRIAEQQRQYRESLCDRYNFILQGSPVSEATDSYISRFARVLVSKDMYEEFDFICSELGEENVLDT
jgi:hypothetical protein